MGRDTQVQVLLTDGPFAGKSALAEMALDSIHMPAGKGEWYHYRLDATVETGGRQIAVYIFEGIKPFPEKRR